LLNTTGFIHTSIYEKAEYKEYIRPKANAASTNAANTVKAGFHSGK
jgi:hypothetical protein